MNPADFSVMPSSLQQLQQEIADECARTDLECKARSIDIVGQPTRPPMYDVSQLEVEWLNDEEIVEANQRDVERAVRYLDLRGLLTRPIVGQPNIVAIGSTT
jgi:hypothetical protein